jgi:hypothetical protein
MKKSMSDGELLMEGLPPVRPQSVPASRSRERAPVRAAGDAQSKAIHSRDVNGPHRELGGWRSNSSSRKVIIGSFVGLYGPKIAGRTKTIKIRELQISYAALPSIGPYVGLTPLSISAGVVRIPDVAFG